jgi:hypothetical protein
LEVVALLERMVRGIPAAFTTLRVMSEDYVILESH